MTTNSIKTKTSTPNRPAPSAAPPDTPRWQVQPSGLSREETRRIVIEQIG